MPRILIITLVFSPDGVSTATLVSQLAAELCQNGNEVTVLTTVPHFNVEVEARKHQPLHRRWLGLLFHSDFQGIRVWHAAVLKKGAGSGSRILSYLLFNILSLIAGLFLVGSKDIVFVVSPPLTSGVVGWILTHLKGARLVYNVQELFPDAFVHIGALEADSSLTRLFRMLERFVYWRTDYVTVICSAFARIVEQRGVPRGKLSTIPNFVDLDEIRPTSKNNALAIELKLNDRFVVLYAGNIGMTQSFDALLCAAAQLQELAEIVFLIVGDGVRRDYVGQQIGQKALHNVIMLPYQPRSRVNDIYATADVGLVPLIRGSAASTLPSKLYSIMAAGRCALAAVDEDSDIVVTIREADCGLAVPPDDAEALTAAILKLYHNQERCWRWGANGRIFAETHYAKSVIARRYNDLFRQLTTLAKT